MSRPLRIEFSGAVYHVTSRGDRRESIYRDDADRTTHLEVIAQAMDRFDAQVLACCQMGNHYHAMLHTRQANQPAQERPVDPGHWGHGVIGVMESGGDLLAPHPDRVLAVAAGQGHEFIEDLARWD